MAEPAKECHLCDQPPTWFIRGKPYCDAHAHKCYEISEEQEDGPT